MGIVVDSATKKIGWSIIGAIPSACVGLVSTKALEKWGVLSPFSEWLGGWLKMHISPSPAGWTIACAITLIAYGTLLWFVWNRQLAGFSATDHPDINSTVDNSRAVLTVNGPAIFSDANYVNQNKWRMTVKNTGPLAARNVQMRLISSEQSPQDKTWTGDYPYTIYPVETITNDPWHISNTARIINPGDDQTYEIVCGWKSGSMDQLFTDINTKGGGHNNIQINPNERWKFIYEVSSENSASVTFAMQIFVENGQVKAART